MKRVVLGAALLASCLLIVVEPSGAGVRESESSPRLTSKVPRFVTRVCASARAAAPIPLVCPPLVPATRYRPFPGLSGALLGNTSRPPVKPPADKLYLLGFNGGDSGPTYWHWIAGMGTPAAIRYWVLSDAHNEVRGRPRRVSTISVAGRRVDIWRFPAYPAGGQFGGHVAAITRSGRYQAIASVHGYEITDSARMAVALARKADASR